MSLQGAADKTPQDDGSDVVRPHELAEAELGLAIHQATPDAAVNWAKFIAGLREDHGTLDPEIAAILDERLADMEANPDDQRPVAEVLAELRATWL